MEKLKFETPDMVAGNIEKIGALFPSAITEMRGEDGQIKKGINFEVLKQLLSRDVVDGDECYEFTWVGKKAAIAEAARPITKTLRPVKEDSRDWDTTQNLYIEGDNLEVLKILQESYLGKVKMIYIDPPYNKGKDFIYPDKFQMDSEEYDGCSGYFDENGNINFNRENSTTFGKYHSDWCSMIYSRLSLARNLLTKDGIIFISIDDSELNDLLQICFEVFGEECYLACFPRITKKAGKTTDAIANNHDYVLAFSKTTCPTLYLPSHTDEGFKFEDEFVAERGKYKLNQTLDYDSLQYSASLDYPIEIGGEIFYPGQSYEKFKERQAGNHSRADWAWRWSKDLFQFGYDNGFVVIKKYDNYSRIYTKTYQNARIIRNGNSFEIEYFDRTKSISSLQFVENEYSNDNSKKNLVEVLQSSVFDYSKPVSLLKTLSQYASKGEDIILDFFSGSATTAHAVMQLNSEDGGHRKFIMVQLPEPCDEKSEAFRAGYKNICEIGKERIRRAGDKIQQARLENISTIQHEWDQTTYYVEHQEECDKLGKLPDEYYEKKFPAIDTGFRVFRVDSSNMKDVYYQPDELDQQSMFDLVSNIKDDRTDMDLLYACLLDWGVEIHLPHTSTDLDGCTVHDVDNGALMACFSPNVPRSVVEYMAKQQPLRAVFRDSAFASDDAKINVTEIFKNLSPDTKVKVI